MITTISVCFWMLWDFSPYSNLSYFAFLFSVFYGFLFVFILVLFVSLNRSRALLFMMGIHEVEHQSQASRNVAIENLQPLPVCQTREESPYRKARFFLDSFMLSFYDSQMCKGHSSRMHRNKNVWGFFLGSGSIWGLSLQVHMGWSVVFSNF